MLQVNECVTLKVDGNLISDQSELADILNDHFVNIAYKLIVRKLNLAILQLFLYVSDPPYQGYCHFIASRYKCRSPETDFQVKQLSMINRNVCIGVTSVLRPADVKTFLIICGSQNHIEASVQSPKIKGKMLKTFEYATRHRLTYFEILTVFACIAVCCLPKC